jgi:hypothetical protein
MFVLCALEYAMRGILIQDLFALFACLPASPYLPHSLIYRGNRSIDVGIWNMEPYDPDGWQGKALG